VGLTDVTIDYSRPHMRGRTIFGDLVPYGKLWRTGANMRTKITFGNDVKVEGSELAAGTYAIFTIPSENSWEVIFYTEYNGGGAPQELDETKVAARVTVDSFELPLPEGMGMKTFTISLEDVTANSAELEFMWDKTYAGVAIEVPTDATVMSAIDKTLAGPTSMDYYQAAVYYLSADKDISKAKEWIDKALEGNEKPAYWQLRQQSLIYAKAGHKKEAIAIAKKSLAAATEAGNGDYVKMNTDSIKEWGGKL
jgi:hypothetical protein